MALKTWILQRMNRIGRTDLPQRASRTGPMPGGAGVEPREPSLRGMPETHEPAAPGPEHLGAYGPLIGAIRDELEHFVASELRLHLAIAERDRYVLTSIEVDCADDADGADLLHRFTRRVHARADQAISRPRRDRTPSQCERDRLDAVRRTQRDAHARRISRRTTMRMPTCARSFARRRPASNRTSSK